MISKTKQLEDVSQQLNFERRFKKLANAIHMARTPNDIMVGLRSQILNVYQVEMATIFLVDTKKMQLVSWVLLPGEFLGKIRVPVDKTSIVGYAAMTRRVVTIQDAYDKDELEQIDPELKFDSSWDKKAGCRTRQVLAMPIMFQGALMGVIQLMNRLDGTEFSESDRKHVADLAETLGIALRNLRQKERRAPTKYDVLVRNDMITEKELDRAFAIANQQNENVEKILMENFRISKFDLGNAIAQYYNTIFVDLSNLEVNTDELYEGISVDYLRKTGLVPIYFEDGKVTMVAEDPDDHAHLYEMRQVFRADSVEVLFSLQSDIEDFLDRVTSPHEKNVTENSAATQTFDEIIQKIDSDDLRTAKERSEKQDIEKRPIVMLVNKIIEDACKLNASDIHIEPYGMQRDGEVRYRVDGQCMNALTIPKIHVRPVVARIKVLADLDISERRKPQDGKIKYRTADGKDIELRIATVPTADGNEDVVLRILAGSEPLPLNKLMPLRIAGRFEPLVRSPYGIIMVVGPTGSGKTTTLHSALNHINTPEKKIWTAEDPVEITQYRLRQVQIHSKIGLTFAAAMRSFLRADPDVIMVGEMRDQETAKMGIEASLTGHLVFSTLHTNSASETIVRLIDMGMDPFNFADALLGILAQRLVRTLCPKCRIKYTDREEYDHLKKLYGEKFASDISIPFSEKVVFYKPKGCRECNNTGYKGRAGLFELLVKDAELNKLIIKHASAEEIKQAAMRAGMTTLLQEGIQMIFSGRTDFKEVMRVCMQ